MIQILHPAAEIEFIQSSAWYSAIDPGLSDQLVREIETHAEWILSNPTSPRLRTGGYRRINLKRFPFYPPFIIEGETIIILAIAHNSRHPDYWKERIS